MICSLRPRRLISSPVLPIFTGMRVSRKKIPEMLDGPVKRLFRLLFSLLTSAFMSALLLFLVRRILAARNMRPGIVENAAFATSLVSLTAANLPLLLEGLRAAVHELQDLRVLITTS